MAEGVVKLEAIFMHISVLTPLWMILVSVEGWTYHPQSKKMNWTSSREWCQTHFTDIVMVHNENVTDFLKTNLTSISSSPYYWIGIRKINDNWTWVTNGQTADYLNWAETEPNNRLTDENCVEMYITNSNKNGKWNDDGCDKEKFPLCHKAQCSNNSCSDKEVCEEQVNSFSCVCKPGFSGPLCDTVVSCQHLSRPLHGSMKCSGLYGDFSLDSKCQFTCAAGYKLKGTAELNCSSSGEWNAPPPSCTGESLTLPLFGGGLMNCTEGHDSSRSACTVQCPPGHLLLGFAEISCRANGTWEFVFPPMCASYVHFLIGLLASAVISMFCGCLCGCSLCKNKKAAGSRSPKDTANPAYETEHPPLEGPLCLA